MKAIGFLVAVILVCLAIACAGCTNFVIFGCTNRIRQFGCFFRLIRINPYNKPNRCDAGQYRSLGYCW